MHWLQSLDIGLFRFINLTLGNPVFDAVMPFVSGNPFFVPALLLIALFLLWLGGARGRLCVLMLALILPLGDGLITNTIKHALERPRPFLALADVHLLLGRGGSGSMPSAHAANWFAAAMVVFVYYRRSLWFMFPAAGLVSFSRVYNGVHYPSDVLAGAILGAGQAAGALWLLNALWQWAGRKWFPLWWKKLPSLLSPSPYVDPADAGAPPDLPPPLPHRLPSPLGRSRPRPRSLSTSEDEDKHENEEEKEAEEESLSPHATLDQHWLRLGCLVIALFLFSQLAYLAGNTIELTGDEAYQWLWSKHLALSYYSKPPLIAYTQFLGTALWGDTAFGVRFFSPVIAAILSLLLLRFFAREVNARAGFVLVLILNATPLLALGTILMTVDPLSVLFWTAAMIAGWRAVQEQAPTRAWFWVGLWMGLGFLSKYTELFQLLCWAVFFALWPPARAHLRRPGPYLALLLNCLCALPVLIWNACRDWPTVSHLGDNASIHASWIPTLRSLRYFVDFFGSEAGLLNPVFSVAMVWAALAFWRRGRHNPRLVYFFSMGAPLFLAYLLFTLHSRVQPNWIAPSVLPLFCLMVIYWDTQWRLGARAITAWLCVGLVLGFTAVVLGHNTELIAKVTSHRLPVKLDPLHRARGWKEIARLADEARHELLAEGKPVFIITDHYRFAGEISFYSAQARAAVSGQPLVYVQTSPVPQNQFYFWPGYTDRKDENAIFVRELDRDDPRPQPPPAGLQQEFSSVSDLGVRTVEYHGELLWPLQLFACRGLR